MPHPPPPKARWSLRASKVTRRALRADPRVEFYVYVPATRTADTPLVVAVHGASRNALQQAKLLVPYAEKHAAVLLAPCFDEENFGEYQRLGRDQPGGRADAVLNEMVQETTWLTGAETAQIHLFGFSGGAQFAHRYTMAHPGRVARTVVVSAGWYTFPDPTERYPYGLRPSRKHALITFDPEAFLRVPITVLVTQEDGSDNSLRRTPRCDAQQGVTRWERGHNWVKAMRAAAEAHDIEPVVNVEEFSGRGRSFKDFMKDEQHGARIFELLLGRRQAAPAPMSEDGDPDREAGDG